MNKNKFTPLTYIVVTTIAILAFLILLALDGRNDSVNEDSDVGVSGFVEQTTRDLFPTILEGLLRTDCEILFHEGNLEDPRFTNLYEGEYSLEISKLDPYTNVPLQCFYRLNDEQGFIVQVHTYAADSKIDNTRADLFERVNSQYIDLVIDQDRIGIIDYAFGTDKANNDECITTMYHPLNDFEVITIEYIGFDCQDDFNTNREIVSILGNYFVFFMENIYIDYADASTENLLIRFGFNEYIPLLNYYK